MGLKTFLRCKAIDITGLWMYKRSELPPGTDLIEDLKYKIDIKLNTIFDVGANTGQSALRFSKVFQQARILSFEPFSSTFDILVKNTRGKNNIECYKVAFSSKAENVKVKLFDENHSLLNSLKGNLMNHKENAEVEEIHTETIDHFLKEKNDIHFIDLLKIDTEGFEIPILEGAAESLFHKRIRLVYVEVGFSKSNERNSNFLFVQEFLEQKNFTLLGYYEVCHWDIKNKNHFGNALYVHNDYLDRVKDIY